MTPAFPAYRISTGRLVNSLPYLMCQCPVNEISSELQSFEARLIPGRDALPVDPIRRMDYFQLCNKPRVSFQ